MVDKQLTARDLFDGFCCGDSNDIECRINENGTHVFKTTIDPIRGVPLIGELKTLRKGPLTSGVFSNSSFGDEVGVGYITTNGYRLPLESDAVSDLLIRIIAECNPCANDEVLQRVQSDCAANCWFDDVNAT